MDASEITYTAPFTGAVQSTLADKLAETVSVTDFGAVRDGNRAHTQAAFEAAIAAVRDYGIVRQHVLHIPAGRWLLNNTLTIPSNLTIIGANKAATMLDFPGLSKACVSMKGAYNAKLSGVLIRNGSPLSGSVGLDMTDSYMCDAGEIIIQDVDIGAWLYGGAFGAYYNELSRIVVSGQNRIGFLLDSVEPYSNVNANTLFACQAHHSEIGFAILSGNNNSLYSPNAETEVYTERFFLIDKSENLTIINPRAEKGQAGPANIGIDITANARGTTIVEGNLQNLTQQIRNLGQGTSIVRNGYTPPIPAPELPPASPGAARYWGVVKTNPAAGGDYHTELQVETATGPFTVTYPMMTSQTGFGAGAIDWSKLVDGSTSVPAFHTDAAAPGTAFRLDLGADVELKKWRFYVSGNVSAVWDVVKSADGTNWATVATGLNCSGGAGWKEIVW